MRSTFIILPCLLLGALPGFAQELVPAPQPGQPAYAEGQLIVRFEHPTTIEEAQGLLADLPYVVERPLIPLLDLYLVLIEDTTALSEAIEQLESLTAVRYAVPDMRVERRQSTPDDPQFPQQWGLRNTDQSGGVPGADIKAVDAWALGTGSSEFVIAIVDGGGQHAHNDLLVNRWENSAEINGTNGVDDDGNGYIDDRYGWNAYNNNGSIPNDSHGTHVAGIAGAVTNNTNGVAGVNWQCKLMYVAGASGWTSTVLTAYNYVLTQRQLWISTSGAVGANVVAANSSFGIDYANCNASQYQPWNDAYNLMGSFGILNAAATINSHVNVDAAGDVPTGCNSPWLISVTNTTRTDSKASAGYGVVTIDLGAPGTSIRSTVPNHSYDTYSGTSMATPHVTGAVAFLHSVASQQFRDYFASSPSQAALELKDIILDNVDVIPSLANITVSGGRLNLHAAAVAISKWGDPGTSFCQSSINSAGTSALISSSGSASVTANDLVLHVTGAVAMQMGLFYYGSSQIQVAFGDGFRCVGGTTARFNPALMSDASGDVARWVDCTQPPAGSGPTQILPGSTWYFQYWYRDVAAGGAGFNLTDGLGVSFSP